MPVKKTTNGGAEEGIMTIDEVLEKWDRGETIWSIEMGGLGPGYEQAIQVLFVEIVRDNHASELPQGKTFGEWGDATVKRLDETCGGFSGAQVGAAKQIAYRLIRDGYDKFKDSIPEDRRIQISTYWPKVEAPR